MYQIFFVFATSERETERGYAIFNIATALVRSLVCCMPPKVAMWLLHFCPIPKKLTQRKGEQIGGGGAASTCATPEPELDQTSIFIDFILCIFSSSPFLFFRHYVLMYFFHFSLAESHMAPSTWSEATSRVWLSTTSPMSIRASTSAVRPATSMARSVSPYPIPFHCKLWVSLCVPVSVYSYVLCTCCCG